MPHALRALVWSTLIIPTLQGVYGAWTSQDSGSREEHMSQGGVHLTARLGTSPEMELCMGVRVCREVSFVYKGLSHTE